jgi:hypothetical protein
MILTENALELIKAPGIRRELTMTLSCVDQTIVRYIKNNDSNGPLTTVAAVQKIKEMTGLSESEILVRESELVTS